MDPALQTWRLSVLALPRGRNCQPAIAKIAGLMSVTLDDARHLLSSLPTTLPTLLSAELAEKWREDLGRSEVETAIASAPVAARCGEHPEHASHRVCEGCQVDICELCRVRADQQTLCATCHYRWLRKRHFFKFRVAVLLTILFGVLLHAARDYRGRHARLHWQRSLEIALILIEPEPVGQGALNHFVTQIPVLESVLSAEFARYGGELRPISFRAFDPVQQPCPPRDLGAPSLIPAPLRFAWALRQYTNADNAAHFRDQEYDATLYVCLSPPRTEGKAFVEGLSENGGRVGTAFVELTDNTVDFGLFVIAHELFHLLGANDRYGADGRTLLPDGLPEPDRDPLFPQDFAEVMARGRVLSASEEVLPDRLQELRVGALTAQEIGWLATAPIDNDAPLHATDSPKP